MPVKCSVRISVCSIMWKSTLKLFEYIILEKVKPPLFHFARTCELVVRTLPFVVWVVGTWPVVVWVVCTSPVVVWVALTLPVVVCVSTSTCHRVFQVTTWKSSVLVWVVAHTQRFCQIVIWFSRQLCSVSVAIYFLLLQVTFASMLEICFKASVSLCVCVCVCVGARACLCTCVHVFGFCFVKI